MAKYNVIGVMSGTSLDGVDVVYCTLSLDKIWSFTIHLASTVPYSLAWKAKLSNLVAMSTDELQSIDKEYTHFLSEILLNFIKKHAIEDIDLICSHGHTALHQPDKGITYQIGNRKELAGRLGYTVVCDFRVQDVELGGQGAPLVPMGDQLLFNAYDYCLNLGGFANISYQKHGERIAYDICPVNIVLNVLVSELGLDFDDEGKMASTGQINPVLLDKLNQLPFYKQIPPKSLGLEWVKANIIPLLQAYNLSIPDKLRTFVEHIAIMISKEVTGGKSLLITGGGAYNIFLIDNIKAKASNTEIVIPEDTVIEYKEALIFALLGVLRYRNEVNVLASVTGARTNHSSGKVFLIS
ncbi:MAG: anhydro-N-acetylmuramic acid kinase [Bacteroidota bacterium]